MKNPTTYDELERFISIYHPNEVIFISNLPTSEVDDIINFANITSSSIHKINISIGANKESKNYIRAKNCEKQIYQKEILHKFYEPADSDVFIQNFFQLIQAASKQAGMLTFYFVDFIFLLSCLIESGSLQNRLAILTR